MFLGLAGAGAAFGKMSQLESHEGFSIARDGRKVHFFANNKLRWTIDPEAFDGRSTIHLEGKSDRIQLSLTNALFPGTRLPASFASTIEKLAGHWKITIRTDTGLDLSADFLAWLLGEESASGTWKGPGIVPFDGFAMRFEGSVNAAFRPDWSIEAQGPCAAVVNGLGLPLRSSSWRLTMNEGDPIAAGPPALRTLFAVRRQSADWDIDLARTSDAGWQLSHEEDLFHLLRVESSNGPHGALRSVLLTQADESTSTLRFHTGGGLLADSGEPFHFDLENPRIAFALEPDRPSSALIAEVRAKAVWAHTEGISLLMNGAGEMPRFELIEDEDGKTAPALAPEAISAAFASDDETQFRMNFKEKRPVQFNWGTILQPFEEGLAHIHLFPGEHNLAFDLTCGDRLHVLRPKDLLNLTFTFENLRLSAGVFSSDIVPNRRAGGTKPAKGPDVGDEGCPPLVPHLRCAPTGGPPKITVIFPPQHLAEEAIYDNPPAFQPGISLPDSDLAKLLPGSVPPLTPAQRDAAKKIIDPNYNTPPSNAPLTRVPLGSRAAGPSQLVFTLPDKDFEIPFSTEDLLDWSKWAPELDPVIKFDPTVKNGPPPPAAPDSAKPPLAVTSIELPWRLMISPGVNGRWAHTAKLPHPKNKIYELWHTRLGTLAKLKNKPVVNESTNDQTIRAIWSPDYRNLTGTFPPHYPTNPHPFRMSLDQSDRNEIVHLTSNYQIDNITGKKFLPLAVPVEQLILSPMGGWLKCFGVWDPPQAQLPGPRQQIFSLQQWKHSATMGRDHYVRVVYKGYLLPFGHRASLIKVTERKFDKGPGNNLYAYLHQRMYIVVQNPRKDFPVLGQQYSGRGFHYKRIDAVTLVTPTLDPPADQTKFWVNVGGVPFPMRFRFWDCTGNTSEADVSVYFADASVANDPMGVDQAITGFNTGTATTAFGGQKQGFAPSTKPGDTDYEVQDATWRVSKIGGVALKDLYLQDQPCFYPATDSAHVTCTSITRVTQKPTSVKVHFYQPYLDNGFDPKTNRGEAFLELATGQTLSLDFAAGGHADQSGALATPNTSVVGFSRKSGPVGGSPKPTTDTPSSLATFASGVFAAADFFGGLASAKILGGLKLSDIIAVISPGLASNLEKAPKMLEQSLFNALGVKPGDLKPLEDSIVAAINKVPPALNRKLGAQKGAVDSTYASVLTADPTDPLPHVALFGAIIQYAEELKNLVENPGEIVDAIWAGFSDSILALAPQLQAALTDYVTSAILDTLAANLKNAAAALNTLFTNSAATLITLKKELPDFASYADLIPLVADLSQRIGTFSKAPKSADAIPSLFQQLTGILDDLLQIFERLGYLNPDTLQNLSAQVVNVENRLNGVWTTLLAVANMDSAQKVLGDLEEACMNYAAGIADQAQAQAFLQNLRQIQNSAQWLMDLGTDPMKLNWRMKTPKAVLQSQIYQVQTQLLTAVQGLYNQAALPADVVTNTVAIAKALTFVEYLYTTEQIETAYFPILGMVAGAADSLRTRLAGLTAMGSILYKLRQEIANPANSGAQMQMTLKIQHFTVSLQYRAPFAVVPEITQLTDSTLAGLIGTALQEVAPLAAQIKTISNALKTTRDDATAGFLKALSDAYGILTAALAMQPALQALLMVVTKPVVDALALAETYASDVLYKAQQVIQAFVSLQQRLEQGVVAAAQDIATAKGALDALTALIPIPKAVTLSYDFHPALKNFEPVFYLDDNADFTITAKTTIPIQADSSASQQPTFEVTATLVNFTIKLIGQPDFVDISFKQVQFNSKTGSSPTCKAQIKGVTFGQDLGFVAELAELLDPDDGPFVEFPAGTIRTGFRFQVDETPVGSFILSQLSFTVAVSLPYNGDPARCDFAISSSDTPFLLSEPPYGGGGFFHLVLGLDGVELLEMALEFGVVADISIGPVSGGGYVMAGIYISIEGSDSKVCGFVHAHGHVDLFEIAQVDVDVYVTVCYNNGLVIGQATITVHVEVLFFSADFQLTASYQFAGSKQDAGANSNGGQVGEAEWNDLLVAPSSADNSADPTDSDCDNLEKWPKYYEYFAA